ncbi:MAG: dipeptidase [Magnetococcales bacterium]|nr:dipeptidase [Magnetococcales bacterium]
MQAILDYLYQHRETNLRRLETLLRIPSVANDAQAVPDIARCAEQVAAFLTEAGMEEVQVMPTGGHPLVTAFWRQAPGCPTLLIYGHYDVQPAGPLEAWTTPPFAPTIRDERMYARGAADDKGQFFMHILAIEAIMKVRGSLPVNVVFLIEGEEEISSPNLARFLTSHADFLQADWAVISDSAMWAIGQPAICLGVRGLINLELTMTGPKEDLHSGSLGGILTNPLEALARLLASVKDAEGRILIPGFYDRVRPPTVAARQQLAQFALDETAYLAALGVNAGWGEPDCSLLERLWLRPTFEINGFFGGFTGQGSMTVIPSVAKAKISLRLVPEQDPEEMVALVTAYLLANTPVGVALHVHRFPSAAHPIEVPETTPPVQAARQALQEGFGVAPLLVREGGSIPVVSEFKRLLDLDTLMVGFSLPDSRIHGPNENLHLPTFHLGIESLVRFYHGLAGQE